MRLGQEAEGCCAGIVMHCQLATGDLADVALDNKGLAGCMAVPPLERETITVSL